MSNIYHYCSIDTFNSIITNKSIRLSDLNKTNDYMEKRWITKILPKALSEELSALGININLTEDYWYSDDIKNHLELLQDTMNSLIYDSGPTLVSCFSKKPDKLSQWRAYGGDGYGVSIGFDYNKLKKLANTNQNLYVTNILYDENSQIKKIGSIIRSAIKSIENLFDSYLVRGTDDFNGFFVDEFESFCDVLSDEIEYLCCCIKNPAFVEEEEIRIIYLPRLHIEMSSGEFYKSINEPIIRKNYHLDPLKYACKNKQLVAYSDLHFEKLVQENIITEIILGPKSRLSHNDVYFFLSSCGFNASDILIANSEATYR